MPLFHGFKQGVLDLGRGEAKAKAKPLTIGDEALDRSAAGLDNRRSERVVQFWLLSDRALFLVVGTDRQDHAYRIPYEAITTMTLDFDENIEFLPWYVRIGIDADGHGTITRLEAGNVPGQPLTSPPPIEVEGDERARFSRGEIIPLAGFAAVGKRFRGAIERRLELSGSDLQISGAEEADQRAGLRMHRKGSATDADD